MYYYGRPRCMHPQSRYRWTTPHYRAGGGRDEYRRGRVFSDFNRGHDINMANKNARRKNRLNEQRKNGVAIARRFELVRKVAERWGKPLQIEHSCDPTGGAGGAEQHIVHCAFGDVPFIVLGAKGVGRTSEEAESNCAWNLMSFFQEYLSRPAMIQIRKKWASADSEIDEAVKVCRRIEDALNSEQFCQLKTQAQSGTGLKRKLSTDPVTEGDLKGSPPMKQSKACQAKPTRNGCVEQNADEYDEDGLHFTYISPLSDSSASSSSSVVCLDADDGDEEEEDDEIMVREARPTSDQPSLNIASSGASRPVSSLRATPHDPLLSGES
ncbi:unnamed protein product [Heligmosomoides polygyrus]|uniref:DRBM domain-containing protein n=1 Tax=Heligmosomoides polygyrus TaxID=6339 RepID=A0A183GMK9_HELPZ|nr:unnamed protein product [Heligmosomoides polygyrus]